MRLSPGPSRLLSRGLRPAVAGMAIAACCVAGPARADGLLGIFFDRNAIQCAGPVPTASTAMLYVLLVTDGATSGGITGAEFRIRTDAANSYLFLNETVGAGVVRLGSALGGGINVAFPSCQSSSVVALLSFQVLNPGSATGDVDIRVGAHGTPANPLFPCPLAVLCDQPVYSKVCVEGGKAILNPAAPRPCGSSRVDSEWTAVKELYRP